MPHPVTVVYVGLSPIVIAKLDKIMSKFNDEDVYHLIDILIAGAIEYASYSNGNSEYYCTHCSASVDEFHTGKWLNIDAAKEHLEHEPNCAYILALSMNVERDTEEYPINRFM